MSARSRAAAVGLCLAATAVAVAGCTPDGEVPPKHASSSASAPPVRLRVAVYGPATVLDAYRTIAADFHAEHSQITVELETYGDEADELRAVHRDAAAGKTPDLFLTGVDALPSLRRDKLIQPVDTLLGERQVDFGDGYPRSALESFSSDAALQCMPTQDSPLVVYYNPDLVDLDAAQGDDHPITATHGWSMEQFSRAVADGDPIYAVILGGAVNQDGRTNGLMAPNPHAQEAVLRTAYARAGVRPEQVGYWVDRFREVSRAA